MIREKKPLGYYNYTVILTYIGMLTGFSGILLAFDHKTFAAVICLMGAAFCDMFDGTVAATRERNDDEKCFGIQIDSLSDLICFGVLPAMIVYSMSDFTPLTAAVCALYALCALIRLSYYNVDEQNRQQVEESSRESFTGMPVTLSAMLVPAAFILVTLTALTPKTLPVALLIVMGVLFLSPFSLKKPKTPGKIALAVFGLTEFLVLLLACGGRG